MEEEAGRRNVLGRLPQGPCEFAGAAVAEHHSPDVLKNRHLLSLGSGGQSSSRSRFGCRLVFSHKVSLLDLAWPSRCVLSVFFFFF